MLALGNVEVGDLIQTVLVQVHLVVQIAGIPAGAAQTLGAGDHIQLLVDGLLNLQGQGAVAVVGQDQVMLAAGNIQLIAVGVGTQHGGGHAEAQPAIGHVALAVGILHEDIVVSGGEVDAQLAVFELEILGSHVGIVDVAVQVELLDSGSLLLGQLVADLVGLGVEGDGHIAVGFRGELVVLAVGAPGVVPGAIGDLTLVGTGGDVGKDLLIQTGFLIESHLVVGVASVPIAAAQVGDTCDIIGACGGGTGGHEAQQHREHQQPTHQLFHVVSSSIVVFWAIGSATDCAQRILYAQPFAHVNSFSRDYENSGKWTKCRRIFATS